MRKLLLTVISLNGILAVINLGMAQSWVPLTNVPGVLWSGALSADGTKLILGSVNSGSVFTSTNSGATWMTNNITSVPYPFWTSVASSADGTKLAAANGHPGQGLIYSSTNAGANWMANNVANELWQSIASSADGTKLIAVIADGPIFTSTNSGQDWNSFNNSINTYYLSVASSADGNKLAAVGGINGNQQLYLSTNSGAIWEASILPISNWYAVASSADGSKLIVAGLNSHVCTSTNSGASWITNNVAGSGATAQWCCVASSADGTRLVAGNYGSGIYISTNSGETWFDSGASSANWTTISASADGNKFLAVAGFGNAYLWQTMSVPVLKITPSNGSSTISWTVPSTSFTFQQNLDLTTTNWVTLTNTATPNLQNLQNEITLPLSNANVFYRLATPQ